MFDNIILSLFLRSTARRALTRSVYFDDNYLMFGILSLPSQVSLVSLVYCSYRLKLKALNCKYPAGLGWPKHCSVLIKQLYKSHEEIAVLCWACFGQETSPTLHYVFTDHKEARKLQLLGLSIPENQQKMLLIVSSC